MLGSLPPELIESAGTDGVQGSMHQLSGTRPIIEWTTSWTSPQIKNNGTLAIGRGWGGWKPASNWPGTSSPSTPSRKSRQASARHLASRSSCSASSPCPMLLLSM